MSSEKEILIDKVYVMVEQFKKESSEPSTCKASLITLKKLKLKFLEFDSFLGGENEGKDNIVLSRKEITLVRETLEYAILLSVRLKNLKMFDLHFKQLSHVYYQQTLFGMPASNRKHHILGMNLLRYLVENKRDLFHSELEEIPVDEHRNRFIQWVVNLDFALMEGSYNQLSEARRMIPSPEYSFFLDAMIQPLRKEISECLESGYKHISIDAAQKMLLINHQKEMIEFMKEKKWNVNLQKGMIFFETDDDDEQENQNENEKAKKKTLEWKKQSEEVIKMTLQYAKQMESN